MTKPAVHSFLGCLLVLLLCALSAPVFAGEPDEQALERAVEHFNAGAEFFAEGRYGRAIVEFRRANQYSPHPMIHYNMSVAYLRIDNFREAYRSAVAAAEMEGLPENEALRNEARIRGLRARLDAEEIAAEVHRDKGSEPVAADEQRTIAPPEEVESAGLGGLGWTGVVLATAGAGLLGYAGVINYQLGAKIESYQAAASSAEHQALRSEIATDTRHGQLALYSGAGLAAVGLTMLVLSSSRSSNSSARAESTYQLQVSPSITGEGGLLEIRGRF